MEPSPPVIEQKEERGGQEVILVVDDEAGVLEFAARSLGRLGYRVVQAGNGKEAMRRIEEEALSPDLLICDLVMPEMGGLTLAGHVSKDHEDTKILFMSAYPDDAADALYQFGARPA